MRSTLTFTVGLFHDEPLDPKKVKDLVVEPIFHAINTAAVLGPEGLKHWEAFEDEVQLVTEVNVGLGEL